MENSTFLIKSTENSSFGTAFCIMKNQKGSYFITCTHVVEDCGVDNLEIEQQKATLVSIGSRDNIDLAVVFVEGLFDCKVLTLTDERIESDARFTIDGFKPFKKESYKLERLNGSIKKISKIYSDSRTIDTYELSIENNDSIEKGYSGSAIVSDGVVVAVATDRNSNGKQAYAIPIGYLKDIWSELPNGLFLPHTFPKVKKSNMLDVIQKYLLSTVIGAIVLGLLTSYLYDFLKIPSKSESEKAVKIEENNSTNSTIELHNNENNTTDNKKIKFKKNQTTDSTIKVYQ
jgi:S1-C subfamily serine protease